MKKLMIAAAAAAMIGAAEAYTPNGAAYDFTATLKTTKAKEGKGSTDKYTACLGYNMDDKSWWYNDEVIEREGDAGYYDGVKVVSYDKNGVGKLNVSKLDTNQKKALFDDLAIYGRRYVNGADDGTGSGYPEYYGTSKEQWCAKYTYSVKNPGQCYRVAGTETVKASYYSNNCCEGDGTDSDIWRLESWIAKNGDQMLPDLTANLLYLFGTETAAKARKIEFVGQIGNGVAANGSFDEAYLPSFALAAQGEFCELKDAYGTKYWGVKSLSGNIVGTWYDPECEVCCGDSNIATCWAICTDWIVGKDPSTFDQHFGTDAEDEPDAPMSVYRYDFDDEDPLYFARYGLKNTEALKYLWGTAAYGSFTLKFNSAKSYF